MTLLGQCSCWTRGAHDLGFVNWVGSPLMNVRLGTGRVIPMRYMN
jgi:hypothetical protein